MSYKAIDRTQVTSRDIILADGQAYDIYMDPWKVATRKMFDDMQAYEKRGSGMHSHAAIKTRLAHF